MSPSAGLLILGLAVACSASGTNPDVAPVKGDEVRAAERRHDTQGDSLAESSGMSSYSSVVIHHPAGHGQKSTSQWTVESHSGERTEPVNRLSYQPKSQEEPTHHRGYSRHASRSNHEASKGSADALFKVGQNYFKLAPPQSSDESQDEEHRHQPVLRVPFARQPAPSPPAGMSPELMQSLLNQQPQTFDFGYRNQVETKRTTPTEPPKEPVTRPTRKPHKKYKNKVQSEATEKAKKRLNEKNRPDSFNVGYSIGFGGTSSPDPTHQTLTSQSPTDVVLGKPKSFKKNNYRMQVNGENSVWKEVQPGLEVSQENFNSQPIPLTIQAGDYGKTFSPQPAVSLMGGHGQPVFYVNGLSEPEIYNVPTTGQATFDHAHALGQSNQFDFSNAMSQPVYISPNFNSQTKQDFPKPKMNYKKGSEPQSYVGMHKPVVSKPQVSYLPYAMDLPKKQFSLSPKSGGGSNSQSPGSGYNPSYVNVGGQSSSHSHPGGGFSSVSHQQPGSFNAGNAVGFSSGNYQVPAKLPIAGGYDLSHYMGVGTPVPVQNVYISGKSGEGQMVPAIVIPVSQLNNFDQIGGMGLEGGDYSPYADTFNVLPAAPRPYKGRSKEGKPKLRPDNSRQASRASPVISHPFDNRPQNARLARLQKELNSILAEEMYRKNNRPIRPALG